MNEDQWDIIHAVVLFAGIILVIEWGARRELYVLEVIVVALLWTLAYWFSVQLLLPEGMKA